MSDLLQQLSSFLNLSKLVAITVPGMVATFALILFFSPTPCKNEPGTCWYCQGQQKDGAPKAKAVLARPQGTYYVSKLTWDRANRSYQRLLNYKDLSKTFDLRSCGKVPQYVVSQSRLKSDKEIDKNLGDLEFVDANALLSTLDACNAALTAAQSELTKKEAAEPQAIAALNANLTALTTALSNAKAAVNRDLERSLNDNVVRAREDLAAENLKDADLKTAAQLAGSLLSQVQTPKNSIAIDAGTAITVDPTPPKTTWQTIAQTIAGGVLLFLLASMAVGQILDPIQRSITSFDPIRGLTFPYLNMFYRSANAMGTIRFGDQRYQRTRRDDVDALLAQDHHILEPSYAIGKGLLTQAEYSALQDQYYSQSQISTGLILPLALLAAVGFFRLLCCKIVVFGTDRVWGIPQYTLPLLWMLAAFMLFSFVLFAILYFSNGVDRFLVQRNRLRMEAAQRAKLRKEACEVLQSQEEKLLELERQIRFDRLDRERRFAVGQKRWELEERRIRDEEERELTETDPDLRVEAGKRIDLERDQRVIREMERAFAHEQEERQLREEEDRRLRDLRISVRKAIAESKKEVAEKTAHDQTADRQTREMEEADGRGLSVGFFIGAPLGLVGLGALIWLAKYSMGNWWLAGIAIGLPGVELFCFVTGIDRLHNFISEVQARIVGVAKKQQESQMQKFADVVTDPNPKKSFIAELQKRQTQITDILGPLTGDKS